VGAAGCQQFSIDIYGRFDGISEISMERCTTVASVAQSGAKSAAWFMHVPAPNIPRFGPHTILTFCILYLGGTHSGRSPLVCFACLCFSGPMEASVFDALLSPFVSLDASLLVLLFLRLSIRRAIPNISATPTKLPRTIPAIAPVEVFLREGLSLIGALRSVLGVSGLFDIDASKEALDEADVDKVAAEDDADSASTAGKSGNAG
jgi:hypothetical protein